MAMISRPPSGSSAHAHTSKSSLSVPDCSGVNHADFSIDGRTVVMTCEYGGRLVLIDLVAKKVKALVSALGSAPADEVDGQSGALTSECAARSR